MVMAQLVITNSLKLQHMSLAERGESDPTSVDYHLARHEPQTWTNMVGVSLTCQLLKSLVGPVYSSLQVVDNRTHVYSCIKNNINMSIMDNQTMMKYQLPTASTSSNVSISTQ